MSASSVAASSPGPEDTWLDPALQRFFVGIGLDGATRSLELVPADHGPGPTLAEDRGAS